MITLLLAGCLPACATGPYEWKYGQDKIVPGQFGMTGNRGSVLTWPSHAVGAVVYPDTKSACIQSAQSAKSRNSSGGGGAALKIPAKGDISFNLAQAITEAVSTLQDKNDVATFADVSLFQICTIATNNSLTQEQTVELIKSVMNASVEIAKARPTLVKTSTTVKPDDATLPSRSTEVSVEQRTDVPTQDKASPKA